MYAWPGRTMDEAVTISAQLGPTCGTLRKKQQIDQLGCWSHGVEGEHENNIGVSQGGKKEENSTC